MGTVNGVLQFQTELHGCGSTTTVRASSSSWLPSLPQLKSSFLSQMTETSLIYTFTLTYSPTPITNTSILKTNPAEVTVQCYFYR